MNTIVFEVTLKKGQPLIKGQIVQFYTVPMCSLFRGSTVYSLLLKDKKELLKLPPQYKNKCQCVQIERHMPTLGIQISVLAK